MAQRYDDVIETLKALYEKGKLTKTQLQTMLASKKITLEEYEYIIGEQQ